MAGEKAKNNEFCQEDSKFTRIQYQDQGQKHLQISVSHSLKKIEKV